MAQHPASELLVELGDIGHQRIVLVRALGAAVVRVLHGPAHQLRVGHDHERTVHGVGGEIGEVAGAPHGVKGRHLADVAWAAQVDMRAVGTGAQWDQRVPRGRGIHRFDPVDRIAVHVHQRSPIARHAEGGERLPIVGQLHVDVLALETGEAVLIIQLDVRERLPVGVGGLHAAVQRQVVQQGEAEVRARVIKLVQGLQEVEVELHRAVPDPSRVHLRQGGQSCPDAEVVVKAALVAGGIGAGHHHGHRTRIHLDVVQDERCGHGNVERTVVRVAAGTVVQPVQLEIPFAIAGQ